MSSYFDFQCLNVLILYRTLYIKCCLCSLVFVSRVHDVTFAGAIRSTEHRALLYAAERLEHLSHVGVRLLFSQHAHKQLPVF